MIFSNLDCCLVYQRLIQSLIVLSIVPKTLRCIHQYSATLCNCNQLQKWNAVCYIISHAAV